VFCLDAGLPGYNSPGEAAMLELACVQPVVQPFPAAHQLAVYCLQIFTLLLGCGKELPLSVLHHVLAALANQPVQQTPQPAAPPTKQQVSTNSHLSWLLCSHLDGGVGCVQAFATHALALCFNTYTTHDAVPSYLYCFATSQACSPSHALLAFHSDVASHSTSCILPCSLLRVCLSSYLQLYSSLVAAFKATRKLSCRASGNSSLQLELCVMSLLQAVTGLAADQGLPADKQAAMAAKLSRAAAELLQETWQPADDEAAEGNKGTPSVCYRGASNARGLKHISLSVANRQSRGSQADIPSSDDTLLAVSTQEWF